MEPIYFVISEWIQTHSNYQVKRILEVIACTTEDIPAVIEHKLKPHTSTNFRVTSDIFIREPDNPFRDQPTKE